MSIRGRYAAICCCAALAVPEVLIAQGETQEKQGSRDRTDTRQSSTNDYGTRDERLANRVRDRLYGSISLAGADIQVKARNHQVTLDGKVANENAKMRAERLAHGVQGVHEVKNNIQVDSSVGRNQTNVSDEQLARQAAQAVAEALQAQASEDWLFGWDVEAGNWEIDVDVDGGVVVLSGDANSYADMNKAVQAARKVSGVKAVRNQIRLSFESRMDYGWEGAYGYHRPYYHYPYGHD